MNPAPRYFVQWNEPIHRLATVVANHPFEYAATLMQMGYDPLPQKIARTWLRRRTWGLTGTYQQVLFIMKKDGFFGLYRGLSPRICESILTCVINEKISTTLDAVFEANIRVNGGHGVEEDNPVRLSCNLLRDIITRTVSVIASQPFYVIAVRMMAQFVGRETQYPDILGSAVHIFTEQGLVGLYQGLVPRLTGELMYIIVSSTLIFTVNTLLTKDATLRLLFAGCSHYVASSVTCLFRVISTCMAVTGSGLKAARRPHMPHFEDWADCWNQLSQKNRPRFKTFKKSTALPMVN